MLESNASREINPNFSFPMAPRPIPGKPFHRPRPNSAGGLLNASSPESGSRMKHAHRRSAAMSEDLTLTDLPMLNIPSTPTFGGSSAPTPSVLTSHMQLSSAANSPPFKSSQPASAMGSVNHTPWLQPVAATSNSSLSSQSTAASFRLQPKPRVSFAEPVSPHRSPWRKPTVTSMSSSLGEPGQLIPSLPPPMAHPLEDSCPTSPVSSIIDSPGRPAKSQAASQATSQAPKDSPRGKHHSRRRSLVKLLKRFSRDSSPGAHSRDHEHLDNADTHPVVPQPTASPELVQSRSSGNNSAYITPPMLAPPRFSSPAVTPRRSCELEPLPPSIDLDEALSCSFAHRRSESVPVSLDAQGVKSSGVSSYIGPVLEETDEEQERIEIAQSKREKAKPQYSQPGQKTVHSAQEHSHKSQDNQHGQMSPSSQTSQLSQLSQMSQMSPLSQLSQLSHPGSSEELATQHSDRSKAKSDQTRVITPPHLITGGSNANSPSKRSDYDEYGAHSPVSSLAIPSWSPRASRSPPKRSPQANNINIGKLQISESEERYLSVPSSPKKRGHNRRQSLLDRMFGRSSTATSAQR